MKCKFKVGDKVEVIDESGCSEYSLGEVLTVRNVDEDTNPALVFCKGKDGGMYDCRFKLVEEAEFDVKSIIKPFMRVVTRNGKVWLAVDAGKNYGLVLADPLKHTAWNGIRNKGEGSDKGFDIIAVYNHTGYPGDLLHPSKLGSLVWNFETEKQLKIEALEKELAELKASN